jgi:NAD:arginine ADP-ribosyltransferase
MNEAMRAGDPALLQQYDSHIRTLTSGLNQLPAAYKYEGVVGRGIEVDPAGLENVRNRYQVGEVVREPSFVSTDTLAAFRGNVQFEIYSRAGRNIREFSHVPGEESEVLFPPGSTFRVLERTFDPASGTWYIRMLQDS